MFNHRRFDPPITNYGHGTKLLRKAEPVPIRFLPPFSPAATHLFRDCCDLDADFAKFLDFGGRRFGFVAGGSGFLLFNVSNKSVERVLELL